MVVAAVSGLISAPDHAHGPRGVRHVEHARLVDGRDLHRRVHPAGGGPADQQGHLQPGPLHLLGHVDHLRQRRRDQAAEPDDVHLLAPGPSAMILSTGTITPRSMTS